MTSAAEVLEGLSHEPMGELVVLADLASAYDLTGMVR
jgi:hypothetical protein